MTKVCRPWSYSELYRDATQRMFHGIWQLPETQRIQTRRYELKPDVGVNELPSLMQCSDQSIRLWMVWMVFILKCRQHRQFFLPIRHHVVMSMWLAVPSHNGSKQPGLGKESKLVPNVPFTREPWLRFNTTESTSDIGHFNDSQHNSTLLAGTWSSWR